MRPPFVTGVIEANRDPALCLSEVMERGQASEQVRRGALEVMGVRTEVAEVGPADASEAVVFLHGNPGSHHDWDDLLPRVASFARGVAFDLPGYGRADRPKELDYSGGMYASAIGIALAELGIERAHLVMHDLGGTGLLWALTNPDAFASAVLIDTGILIDFRWHITARLYRAPLLGELFALATTERAFRAFMRQYNPQPRQLPDQFVERVWSEYDLGTRRAALRFYRRTPPPVMEPLAPGLARLDCPALVVWGAHDPAVPVEQAERQRRSFPSAEVVVFEDSGHWPHIDDPERAAQTIVPFLQRQLG
jgi:pimeloyl-ACP methyl ester carboxylesterase